MKTLLLKLIYENDCVKSFRKGISNYYLYMRDCNLEKGGTKK